MKGRPSFHDVGNESQVARAGSATVGAHLVRSIRTGLHPRGHRCGLRHHANPRENTRFDGADEGPACKVESR
nr:hypothetical protein [Candidatus Sigynarchaeum springense]